MNSGAIMKRMRAAALLLAVLLVAIASPLGVATVSAQDTSIVTRVQFLHAGTDLGEVEVHLNGQGELEEFGYGDQSDWIALDPGSVQLTLTAERAGFNYAIFDGVYPVPAGNDYYVVITDEILITGAFDTASAVADQASRVQIVHASIDTPAVTVNASGETVALATELAFPRTSESSPLPASTYDIEVALADTGDVVLTQPGVVIDAAKSYVLVLIGDPSNEDKPLEVVALESDLTEDSASTPAS
jgi:hypothetical protein